MKSELIYQAISEIVDDYVHQMFHECYYECDKHCEKLYGDLSEEHEVRLANIREEIKFIIKETIKRNKK